MKWITDKLLGPLIIAAVLGLFSLWSRQITLYAEVAQLKAQQEQQRQWLIRLSQRNNYYHGADKSVEVFEEAK